MNLSVVSCNLLLWHSIVCDRQKNSGDAFAVTRLSQLNRLAHEIGQDRNIKKTSLVQIRGGTLPAFTAAEGPRRHTQLAGTDFEISENTNATDSDVEVTVYYDIPGDDQSESKIAFLLLSLPPGYTIPTHDELKCWNANPSAPEALPPLSCVGYRVKRYDAIHHVVIMNSDPKGSLPNGAHAIRMMLHTPKEWISVDQGQHWWYATFRFTTGHYITKHFENRRLADRGPCLWSKWRQETPCSTTCGGGLKVYTRTLYSGPAEMCNTFQMKVPCNLHPCVVACEVSEWAVAFDCSSECDAGPTRSRRISARKVKVYESGGGASCRERYPWDPVAQEGWSDELRAVVRYESCEGIPPCENQLGCRADLGNRRTIPFDYPWGTCPFPCGGHGHLTALVQVANGIPSWIGKAEFGNSFEAPCVSDKTPQISKIPCNTAACDDCTIYLENPRLSNTTKAWIFFMNRQETDRFALLAPPGGRFPNISHPDSCSQIITSFGSALSCEEHTLESPKNRFFLKMKAAGVVSPSRLAVPPKPNYFTVPIVLSPNETNNAVLQLFLYSSNSLREPEVFDCPIKTYLRTSSDCSFEYTPLNPEECQACKENKNIQVTRRFIPDLEDGSCNIAEGERHEIQIEIPCNQGCPKVDSISSYVASSNLHSHLAQSGEVPGEDLFIQNKDAIARATADRIHGANGSSSVPDKEIHVHNLADSSTATNNTQQLYARTEQNTHNPIAQTLTADTINHKDGIDGDSDSVENTQPKPDSSKLNPDHNHQVPVQPTYQEHVTAESVPQEPATQAPVTQAPVTQAPVTQAPVTQEPATQEPATQEPAAQAPVTQEPATKQSTTDNSASALPNENSTAGDNHDKAVETAAAGTVTSEAKDESTSQANAPSENNESSDNSEKPTDQNSNTDNSLENESEGKDTTKKETENTSSEDSKDEAEGSVENKENGEDMTDKNFDDGEEKEEEDSEEDM